MNEQLEKLLETMDVPKLRKADLHWLNRNLAVRNSKHENFEEARKLIKELLSAT